jgi:hypothetical protein
LYFGKQRFRLSIIPGINITRLDIEGSSPLALKDRVFDEVRSALDENMKAIEISVRVPLSMPDGSTQLVSLDAVTAAVDRHDALRSPSGKEVLTATQVIDVFKSWIVDKNLLMSYQLFVSYRWGQDSDLVKLIFDTMTRFTYSSRQDVINVFADTVRLKLGLDFRSDLIRSLVNSEIVMSLVTDYSLDGLREVNSKGDRFDPQKVDNLLIEWILAEHLLATNQGKLKRIAPLILGCFDPNNTTHRQAFDKGSLSEEVPTATLIVVEENLQSLGLPPLSASGLDRVTVKKVVEKLRKAFRRSRARLPKVRGPDDHPDIRNEAHGGVNGASTTRSWVPDSRLGHDAARGGGPRPPASGDAANAPSPPTPAWSDAGRVLNPPATNSRPLDASNARLAAAAGCGCGAPSAAPGEACRRRQPWPGR